ncbi:MAG: metallopeptidase family protein [Phycisphaerales bacterium]|nr:metallopeptidase family protein [Phycisphaerales bacterium]
MDAHARDRFDRLFEQVWADLPAVAIDRFDEVPVVLDDQPDDALLAALQCEPDDICGLHTGVPLTHRSVDDMPDIPDVIHLFRRGIVAIAGGWEAWVDHTGACQGGDEAIRREIRITLLHELGHHFGLDESDLDRLGYA